MTYTGSQVPDNEDERSIVRLGLPDSPSVLTKEALLSGLNSSRDFEQDVLPHLNSVYNLARQLARNEHDAEDIAQEAYLRAFRFYDRFRGGNARPWLMKIVRNVFYDSLRQSPAGQPIDLDQDFAGAGGSFGNPEDTLIESTSAAVVRKALETLPTYCREVLVLRELEGMSYKEISSIIAVPAGTVMSRLSRARGRLRQALTDLTGAARGAAADDEVLT